LTYINTKLILFEGNAMKKLFFLIQLTAAVMMYSSISYADRDDHGWGGYGHHGRGHHGHYRGNYYPQPQVNYYPQPPRYSGYNQRSPQGLAGGVIGSVFGYEMGNGNPVAAGLGAAAGSYLGNGWR
jgi:hypothetical protein